MRRRFGARFPLIEDGLAVLVPTYVQHYMCRRPAYTLGSTILYKTRSRDASAGAPSVVEVHKVQYRTGL